MIDEPGAEVVIIMPGAGVTGEGLLHQANAVDRLAQVEEGQSLQVPDVVAVR